jgi:hypothetical protein
MSKFKVQIKRFCHKEHTNSIAYHSKDMAKVKVFKKQVKLQDQG